MNSVAFTPFGPDYDCVMDGWEPKENEDGVVYFSNSHRKTTSWTHPYLDKIFEELSEYNEVRYAAYRTALKLRCLQLKSGLSWLTLRGIKKILIPRRDSEDSYREAAISHNEAFSTIVSILKVSDSLSLHRSHFMKAAEIIVHLLVELYDPNYEGKFAVSSLKISLAALCSAQLSEKYRFFFSEIYNHDDGTLQREKLLYFFYDLMQIVEALKESTAFGTNVSVAVDSCLNYRVVPSETGRSSEDGFYSWLLLEPQIMVWLPTLHRLAATENVCHDVHCSVCGINPVKGIRYRCLQCFRYDLCQECFFLGNVSLTHKQKHPMQEYCLPATKKDNTKAVLKILRNKLSKKHRSQSKVTYLPLDADSITGSVFQWQPRHRGCTPRDTYFGSRDSGLANGSDSDVTAQVDASLHADCTRIIFEAGKDNGAGRATENGQMSKRDMLDQQGQMAKRIEELQEENKYLQDRLRTMNKLETDSTDACSDFHSDAEEIVRVEPGTSLTGLKSNQSLEDTDPIIISSIECESLEVEHHGSDLRNGCSKATSEKSTDEDSLPNVMEIVGYYTPVRSSLCQNQQLVNAREVVDNLGGQMEESEDIIGENVEPFKKQVVSERLVSGCAEEMGSIAVTGDGKGNTVPISYSTADCNDDVVSESTASEGLEYHLSDMSCLSSENMSQKTSSRGRETNKKVPVYFDGTEFISREDSECPGNFSMGSIDRRSQTDAERCLGVPKKVSQIEVHSNCDALDIPEAAQAYSEQPCNIDPSDYKDEHHALRQFTQSMPSLSQTANTEMDTNELFFNISDILHEGSALPIIGDTSNKPLFTPSNEDVVPERRRTLEPVFMSTPVMDGGAQTQQAAHTCNKTGKENRNRFKTPVGNTAGIRNIKEGSLQRIAVYRCKAFNDGVTPTSSSMTRQNKRPRLSSRENLLMDDRSVSQSVELSHRDLGMTTMFDKAERLGALQSTSPGQSLAMDDKEEVEKLLRKLSDSGDSSSGYRHVRSGNDSSSSSMLNAVLGVGDAMADLVVATKNKEQQQRL